MSGMLISFLGFAQGGSPAYNNCSDSGATIGTLSFPATICPDGNGFSIDVPGDATYSSFEFVFENPNDIVPESTLGPGGPRIVSISSTGTFNPADYGLAVGDQICGIGFGYNLGEMQAFIDGFTPGGSCCTTLNFVGIDCNTFPDGSSITGMGDIFAAFGLTDISLADLNNALGLLPTVGCGVAPCYISSQSACMTITECGSSDPCLSYAGGPYSDQEIDVAGCDGSSISAPYAAWQNEVYFTDVLAGGNYTFSICDGYDAANWGDEALITAVLNATPNGGTLEGGTVLGVATGCSITFDAPEDGTVFFTLTTAADCGGEVQQIDNGVPTITTNSGVACGTCGDGECGPGENYGNCAGDCPCSSEGAFVDFNDQGQAVVSEAAALYCESAFTGIDAPFAYVPLAVFGDGINPYQLSNEDGMLFVDFDADNNVVPVTEVATATLVFLQVNQASFDASGGTTTVTYIADGGACTTELTIDWAAFEGIDIDAVCGAVEPPTCDASYGTVLFDGETTLCEGTPLAPICLDGANDTPEYASVIVVTVPPALNIVGIINVCEETDLGGLPAGDYLFHALNILLADTTTLTNALAGGATGVDVANLITDGTLCAALDVTGIAVTILGADDPACQPASVPPTAENVSESAGANPGTVTIQLSEYVSDEDSPVLTYDVAQPDQGGSLTFDATTGAVIVTVDENFTGLMAIEYSVSDGQNTATASISILIQGAVDVSLVRLTGKAQANGNLIEWATATELNNDHFTLYSSTNGANYTAIATIKGAGNSSVMSNYQLLDKNAANGLTYYRLTQTDYDGTSTQVGVVAVRRGANVFVSTLEPNPATNLVNVSFTTTKATTATLSIHDVTGRLVVTQQLNTVAGNNSQTIDISHYATGIYFVTINTPNGVSTAKLLKK